MHSDHARGLGLESAALGRQVYEVEALAAQNSRKLNPPPVEILAKVHGAIVKVFFLWKPGGGKLPVNKYVVLVVPVERGQVCQKAVHIPRRAFAFVAKKSRIDGYLVTQWLSFCIKPRAATSGRLPAGK